jgi:hypothetical protein
MAVVQYYLKDRLNTGDVSVEVYDPSGKLVATLPGTKRKGINFVRWDMRTAAPKAAKGVMVQGEMGVVAGFVGQLSTPGTFKVKVKAGNFVEEGVLELIPDPLTPNMNYTLHRSKSTEFFTMVEDLGLLEAQVQHLKDSVEARAKVAKDKKLKTSLTQLATNLTELRKTLTETIESKGITGEQQLRARIGRLYVMAEISDDEVTQSILDGAAVVREELQQAHAKADGYFKKDLAAVNTALQKEKLKPLTVLDKAAWEKMVGNGAPASSGGLFRGMQF